MFNKTSANNATSQAYNSSVSASNNTLNDSQPILYVTGQALLDLYQRTVSGIWSLFQLGQTEKIKMRIHNQKMESLNQILTLQNLTFHQLTVKIIDFYATLSPFMRMNIDNISREVFEHILKSHGRKAAMYVASKSNIPELQSQLDQLTQFGKSYKDLLYLIAGLNKVTESEDLKQLEFALEEQNFFPKSSDWGIKIDDHFITRIQALAKNCPNNQCNDAIANKRAELLAKVYPPRLIKAVGGVQKFLNIPILSTTEHHLGWTGYIDMITPAEMQHPLMRGIDAAGRPFLAVCYTYKGSEHVEVLFQRHSKEYKSNWVSGTCSGLQLLNSGAGISGIDQIPDLEKDEHYTDDVSFLNNIIEDRASARKWHKEEKNGVKRSMNIEEPNGEPVNLCRR